MKRGYCLVCAAAVVCIYNSQSQAQPAILWSTVEAGGGRVVHSGGLALEGTIGQFDIGLSTAGMLRGEWGFWPGVRALCRGDFNSDGSLTSQDFFDYLSAFFETTPIADFNYDDVINSQDFFEFLTAFFAGC